jgi:hypothetical protein
MTPDRLRGRVMGIFQLSNQGLNPLGQVETGLLVPAIGARAATVLGGLIVSCATLATAWRIGDMARFSLDAPREQFRHDPESDIKSSTQPLSPQIPRTPAGEITTE